MLTSDFPCAPRDAGSSPPRSHSAQNCRFRRTHIPLQIIFLFLNCSGSMPGPDSSSCNFLLQKDSLHTFSLPLPFSAHPIDHKSLFAHDHDRIISFQGVRHIWPFISARLDSEMAAADKRNRSIKVII